MRWIALSLLLLPACSSDDAGTGAPDEYVTDCEGVTAGAAFASDENWDAFINAEAAGKVVHDTCLAPSLTAPAAGTVLDPDAPPQISFAPTGTGCATALSPPSTGRACRAALRSPSLLARLGGLIEGTAQAHCGAFTGENYVVRLRTTGDTVVYTAVLSVTSYTPDAAAWKKDVGAHRGQTLSLSVERGVFFRGTISEGPYLQPAPVAMSVRP